MYKVIRRILFGSLLAVLIAGIYMLLATQAGLTTLYQLAQQLLPGQLSVGNIQGKLLSNIDLENLQYRNASREISIESLHLSWQPQYLLQGKFYITELYATQVTFRSFTSTKTYSEADWQRWLDRLRALQVENLQLQRIIIQPSNLTISAFGKFIEQRYDLRWQMQGTALQLADSQSDIKVIGTIQGTRAAPQFFIDVVMRQIHWQKLRIAQLNSTIQLQPAAQQILQMQTRLSQLKWHGYQTDAINLTTRFNRDPWDLQVQLAPGRLHFNLDNKLHTLAWQTSRLLQAQFTAQGLQLTSALRLDQQQFNAQMVLLNYKKWQQVNKEKQKIKGKLQLLIPQILPWTRVFPNLKNFQGRLQINLALQGTLAKPQLTGTGVLDRASVDIPLLNLHLTKIYLQAMNKDSNTLTWNGNITSGKGILHLTGNTLLTPTAFPSTLQAQGDNVLISNSEDYQITATPNVKLTFSNKGAELTGKVFIPQASLRLGTEESQMVTLSSDVVFANQVKPTPFLAALPLTAQLQLVLGDKIKLRYQGLDAKLSGDITLTAVENRPVTASGQIDLVKGNYNYRGQILTISSNSRLVFTGGPADDPVLNVQASKTVTYLPPSVPSLFAPSSAAAVSPNLAAALTPLPVMPEQTSKMTVGVRAQGTAKNPQITLFSDPAILSQADILSYILFDQPASQLGSSNAQLLFNAASSLDLGTSQFKQLMQSLQKNLGLSQFTIQATPYIKTGGQAAPTVTQNTSLILGKALSPHLYVNYSVGLVVPINILQIRYLINQNWSLQSSTSALGNGVDLLYTLER